MGSDDMKISPDLDWTRSAGTRSHPATRPSPNFKREDPRHARRHLEGSGRLVGPLVFKTSVQVSWQAGSIPVPLRVEIGENVGHQGPRSLT